MGAIAGWAVVMGLLIIGSAIITALPLALARRAMPRTRVPGGVYMIIILTGAVGLWYLIPFGIHALVGRMPY